MAPRSTVTHTVGVPITARDRARANRIAEHREACGTREDRRAAHHRMLADIRQWAETPEGAETVARVAARPGIGDHYSALNVAAIAYQCPEAVALNTYRGWKAEGGQVQRGAKAIRITSKGGSPTSRFDVSQTDLAASPDYADAVAEACGDREVRSDDIPF